MPPVLKGPGVVLREVELAMRPLLLALLSPRRDRPGHCAAATARPPICRRASRGARRARWRAGASLLGRARSALRASGVVPGARSSNAVSGPPSGSSSCLPSTGVADCSLPRAPAALRFAFDVSGGSIVSRPARRCTTVVATAPCGRSGQRRGRAAPLAATGVGWVTRPSGGSSPTTGAATPEGRFTSDGLRVTSARDARAAATMDACGCPTSTSPSPTT